MFISSLQDALLFIVYTIFNAYIIIILFRFMLQLVQADMRNPLAQFIAKVTNPILAPLESTIPSTKNISFAALCLALFVQIVELLIILFINGNAISPRAISIPGITIWAVGELCDLFLVFIFFATLIQAILSWVNTGYNPAAMLFARITEPFLRPIRNILPAMGGLDFSPIVLIFLIYLLRILVANPIIMVGRGML